jgi:galactose mutarotase-like enzyme
MVTIENDILKIDLISKGAELQSIFHKIHNLAYMWGGDPVYWSKRSPVLFPIVGTLKNDTFFYEDRDYHLGRHGFARDLDFEIEKKSHSEVIFLLKNSAQTLAHFPFEFELRIKYAVEKNNLIVEYMVKNPSEKVIYFSMGGHPAFKVPLMPDTVYSDYYLQFNQHETFARWPIAPEGLIEQKPVNIAVDSDILPLTHELFYKDALVFKDLKSAKVSLRSKKTDHGLDFDISEFPYLGIWAAKNADFVCIEPWCGIADSTESNQQIEDKEGINRLVPDAVFARSWTVGFY